MWRAFSQREIRDRAKGRVFGSIGTHWVCEVHQHASRQSLQQGTCQPSAVVGVSFPPVQSSCKSSREPGERKRAPRAPDERGSAKERSCPADGEECSNDTPWYPSLGRNPGKSTHRHSLPGEPRNVVYSIFLLGKVGFRPVKFIF